MARKTKPSKFGELIALIIIGAVVHVIYGHLLPTVSWALIALAVFMLWISFFMPTYCDYRTQRNRPCRWRVRGKLRGCGIHARDKRDALWRACRLKNPGTLFRVMWASPDDPPPARPGAGTPNTSLQPAATQQGARDAAVFYCTLVSTVAGVISAIVGVLALTN
ncbi:hypothetical protein EV191_11075 [Tamaricihabitans halophyticus]|uniref:Uncharacterized protein n=1 Tax=Tamaricihabitans halophyticus TaxID=1262583 RepID=A0A4R2QJ66_9PSEU|nr:hypothetical protein [Tamaricihabitans halophyticus]TCP48518.1 hypothetical protein EV191_11075 [Tamaricihabitans halophyticus]